MPLSRASSTTRVAAIDVSLIVEVLVYVIALIIALLLEEFKPSYPRFFLEQDPTISRPVLAPTVPSWLLWTLAVCIPAVALLLLQQLTSLGRATRVHVMAAFAQTIITTEFITAVVKCTCGRLRPNSLALCDYHGYGKAMQLYLTTGSSQALDVYFNLTHPGRPGDFKFCHASGKRARDAHLSFPSGHTSMTFAGLGFLGLVAALAARKLPFSAQVAALLAPLGLALWVGCTRIRDYYHNEDDVLGGAVLGLTVAKFFFETRLRPQCEKTSGGDVSDEDHQEQQELSSNVL